MRIFAICLMMISACASHLFGEVKHPEKQIIIVENFISPDQAAAIIQYYDAEKRGMLDVQTENIFPLQSVSDPKVREILLTLSNQILGLIQQKFHPEKWCQLDFCALAARIKGNSCPYHSDNIRFECPVHGQDQSWLRRTCDGKCPGARFVPNHTAWRKYTGLVYLDDGFKGGEILFEDGPHNRKYQKVIPIKAGMLVLTPNGPDFYHEVFPIRKGIRHAAHFWYTDDPSYFFY